MGNAPSSRSGSWKWWVCGLLLFASTINYMDRQTLANASVRLTHYFQLSQTQYGNLEFAFGWAFAAGSLVFGFLVDRVSVRWVYPAVLLCWSAVGFATGSVTSYTELLVCRGLLGFFEAGHWPCAIKTTVALLEARDRPMGNSVLQSGTSIGAIVTPILLRFLLTDHPESWRLAFEAVGAIGVLWIVAWFLTIRPGDLDRASAATALPGAGSQGPGFLSVLLSRRMAAILVMIASINTTWQVLRAWLPKFLQEGRGFTEKASLDFNVLFYIATDVGCLGAGALTLWLVRRGARVHASRVWVFLGCSLLAAFTSLAAVMPQGWVLGGSLLLAGAGVLGLFPIYHALTQDLSPAHQGKVTGVASVAAWMFAPPLQSVFGAVIDRTGSYDLGIAIIGWLPLLSLALFCLLWRTPQPTANPAQ